MKRTILKYSLVFWVIFSSLLAASTSLNAQGVAGVTDKEILIGSCSALEGPSHFLGTETVAGAKAYFAMINDAGGVDGRKLRLLTYDDSYDPAKTESSRIPVVGLFTGAQTLYVPLRHWVVNVRASYFDETREQIDGLWGTLGYKKIGVIYPEDA